MEPITDQMPMPVAEEAPSTELVQEQPMKPNSKERNEKIAKYIGEEFQRYEAAWADKFQEAEKDYDNWIGKPPKREYDWQNQIHVPLTFEAEQTLTPRIFTALFPSDAPLDVQVEGDSSPEQGVKIKHLISHFFRVSDAQGESIPMLQQNTLFGTGYMEGGSWLVKRGWQIDKEGKRYYTIVESRPDSKWVDFFEILPHPAKMEMWDGLPLMRRRFIDQEMMKALVENPYFRFENVQAALDSKIPNVYNGGSNCPAHYMPKPGECYEIIDYWGPWDEETLMSSGKINIKRQVPYWCIVINRKIVLRAMPNPYNHQGPPFLKVRFYEDVKPSWFGVGVGKVGRASQERVNKIVNSRLDNVDLVMNKMGFYNGSDPLLNVKKLQVSKPGLWHKVSDTVASVRWMETPDVTQSSYLEEEKAKQDFREATGATMQLMPSDQTQDQHRTAMGIQLLQGAAGMRFRPILRRLERDFVQQLAMFYFANLNQFMTESEWVEVTGEGGETKPVQVSPEDIQARVFFIPTGISETLNKEVQVGQLLRFKEVTANDPTVNRAELNKRIAELLGFKDVQKLLVPQAPAGPQGSSGELHPDMQGQIQRRMAEGANMEQIKMEMLGPKPAEGNPNAPA